MNRNQLIAVIAIAAMLAVTAGALVTNDVDAYDGDTLVVETSPDFPPFDYKIGKEYVGIDMDVVRAICNNMGYKVEFRTNSFDSIIMSVNQGKCDIGASGFSIKPDREKEVNFSTPYADIHQAVVAAIDSDITCAEDLKRMKISVQTGTTGADYAEELAGKDHIIPQKSYSDVINDLLTGKADCEVVDSAVGIAQVAAHPTKLKLLDVLTESPIEKYGFIFAKNDAGAALRDKFNASFEEIKLSGLYYDIEDYYLENGYTPDTASFFSSSKVTVATVPEFAPFEYMYDKEFVGTQFTGIDMDIKKHLMSSIGKFTLTESVGFDNLIQSVHEGKYDIGMSAITITDERKDLVLFSDPYAEVHQVVVAPESFTITTSEELKGKNIAVQADSTSKTCAAKYSDYVITFDDYESAIKAVVDGTADCVMMDDMHAKSLTNSHSGLKTLDILDEKPEFYGFIFPLDHQDLCNKVNVALATMKDEGILDKIFGYYEKYDYQAVGSYFDSQEYRDEQAGESKGFWDDLADRFYTDFIKNDRYQYIFDGLKNTLIIAALALVIGMGLGTVVAMVRSVHDQTGKLKILNAIGVAYTTVIRGTPVMVQLMLIYYVIFASSSLNSVLIASVAFGLNSGAYVAEVVRAGITAVPKGQMEACRSLGMSNRQAMTSVILPQAMRNILPALGNEGISLLKETSVAGYIGIVDLTKGADLIRGQTYDALLPMLVVAVIYLSIVMVLAYLVKKMEKRLNNAY